MRGEFMRHRSAHILMYVDSGRHKAWERCFQSEGLLFSQYSSRCALQISSYLSRNCTELLKSRLSLLRCL